MTGGYEPLPVGPAASVRAAFPATLRGRATGGARPAAPRGGGIPAPPEERADGDRPPRRRLATDAAGRAPARGCGGQIGQVVQADVVEPVPPHAAGAGADARGEQGHADDGQDRVPAGRRRTRPAEVPLL